MALSRPSRGGTYKKEHMKLNAYASLAAGAMALLMSLPASSANVDINIDIPGAYAPPPPVYVQPRPVYVQPQAVYVERDDGQWDCRKDKCKGKKHKKDKHYEHHDHHGHDEHRGHGRH
jgi:hypothetical protein